MDKSHISWWQRGYNDGLDGLSPSPPPNAVSMGDYTEGYDAGKDKSGGHLMPQLTGLEKEAEQFIQAFPKEPIVTSALYSIAISLRRLADAVDGTEKSYGIHRAILDIANRPVG